MSEKGHSRRFCHIHYTSGYRLISDIGRVNQPGHECAAVAVSCFSRQAEYCGYAASLAQSRCACRRPVRDKCEASREYSSRCVPSVASLAISSHSAASLLRRSRNDS